MDRHVSPRTSRQLAQAAIWLLLIGASCDRSGNQPPHVAAPIPEQSPPAAPSSPESEVPEAVKEELARVGAMQSKALDGATIQVHQAFISRVDSFRIQEQYRDSHQVVVVDVTFEDFGDYLDLDDIEIVDAASDTNYGSDPLLYGVRSDGEVCDIDDAELLRQPRVLHVLLGYSIPKACRAVQLAYWGETITPIPATLQPNGPPLPKADD